MAKNTVIPATLDFRRRRETPQKVFSLRAYKRLVMLITDQ
jgi:hypothetical protein